MDNNKIISLSTRDKDYPEGLRNIFNPPKNLYTKGKIPKGRLFFAIVGARLPTPYGTHVAYKLAKELAEVGIVIVSGLARGIDALAHKGCLDGGGKTIAVLGCSVDRVYPAENYYLYRKIIERGGAIISEIPPGTTVQRELFAQRNRIISGLSEGMLVVEGGDRSGTLITTRFAGDQGKDLFAVPGPITSSKSFVPNLLIQNGAKLVTKVEDILEEYGIDSKSCFRRN